MIKKILALQLLCLATNTQADSLECHYPPSNYPVKNNSLFATGKMESLQTGYFIFKTDSGLVITSSLVNCRIEVQT